jgi:hypothetical protein
VDVGSSIEGFVVLVARRSNKKSPLLVSKWRRFFIFEVVPSLTGPGFH